MFFFILQKNTVNVFVRAFYSVDGVYFRHYFLKLVLGSATWHHVRLVVLGFCWSLSSFCSVGLYQALNRAQLIC